MVDRLGVRMNHPPRSRRDRPPWASALAAVIAGVSLVVCIVCIWASSLDLAVPEITGAWIITAPIGFAALGVVAADRLRHSLLRTAVIACCATGTLLFGLLLLFGVGVGLLGGGEQRETIERIPIPATDLTVETQGWVSGSSQALAYVKGQLGPFPRSQLVGRDHLVVLCSPRLRPDRPRSVVMESSFSGESGCSSGTWRVTVLDDGWSTSIEVMGADGNWRPW